jgi:RNA polymerase sigma-70 factor (ECF subfamily)
VKPFSGGEPIPRAGSEDEDAVSRVYREEGGRLLATLIGLLGDFDLAEEALQEALAAAVVAWPRDGVPAKPRAWLVSTARHKAIDRMRRAALDRRKLAEMAAQDAAFTPPPQWLETAQTDEAFPDERLRLLFTCCHPALAPEAQVALTLRTLCGLSSEQIARAFLLPVATLQQRLVRAKAKIRDAKIPYRVPEEAELPVRLDAVLRAIYLIFNEGYAPTAGESGVRPDLCEEAIRLARLVVALLPARSEALALLALALLHDARRAARFDSGGDLVLLAEQDRSLWDRRRIAEGLALAAEALRRGKPPGSFALQAAIAGVHAAAGSAAATDWRRIAALYAQLSTVEPSPVVELNRAVAVAMSEGPGAGLELLDRLDGGGALEAYHLLPATRAGLLRQLGRTQEAIAAYERALALAGNEPERRFLSGRLAELLAPKTEQPGGASG